VKQPIIGGYYNLLNTSATEYNCLMGGYTWDDDPDDLAQAIPAPGKLRNLRVELNDVPGTGTYTFTLYRRVGVGAWGDTTLTCTVAADGTVATDTAHDVTVAAGDVVCLKCAPSSPDNTRYARWAWEFEGDTANESLLLLTGVTSATQDRYYGVQGKASSESIENDARCVCPTPGKIKDLFVQLKDDPGTAPDAYRIVLRVNGADSDDGGGNALECTIVANNKTGNDTTHEISVAAGDILTVKVDPVDSPTVSTIAAIGMTFVANTDGESIITGGTDNDLDSGDTEYNYLCGWGQWGGTEAQRYQLAQECVFKKLYVLLSGDPGGTDKYTFTVRLEGASPADGLAVEIAGGSTTGNDTAHTISVSDGEVVNLMCVPTDTPAVKDAYWGLVCYIVSAVAHEKALSDTVTIGDTIVKAVGQPHSDSVALSDALTKGVGQPHADTLALADTLTTKAIGQAHADTVAIGDALAKVVEFYRAESDSITIADSLSKTAAFEKAFSDNVAITDTLLKDICLNEADTLAIADAILIGNIYSKLLSDTIAITDDVAKGLGLVESDSIAISDSLSKVSAFLRSLSDTVTISDSIADVVDFLLSIGDSVAITDAPVKGIGIAKADSVTIADTIVKEFGLSESDSQAIADSIVKTIGLTEADTVALVDSIIKAIGLPEADSLAISDSMAKALGYYLYLADTVSISDSIITLRTIFKSLSDTIAIADTISKSYGLSKADSMIIADVAKLSYRVRAGIAIARLKLNRIPHTHIHDIEV